MKKIRKAIIPVAGIGTRMLPATKSIPKEMLPIYDKPLIQLVVEEAIDGGIEEIILITRSGKEAIENHFEKNYELEKYLNKKNKKKELLAVKYLIQKKIKIYSIRQENPLGLGHAILCAKDLIKNENFVILLPDEILFKKDKENDLKKMIDFFHKTNNGQILVDKVKKKQLENYGVVNLKKKNFKKNVTEKIYHISEKPNIEKAPSNYRVVGRYVLPHEVFSFLEKCAPDKSGEIQLTEALNKLSKDKGFGLNALLSDSNIFDCGTRIGFIGANITTAMKEKGLKKYIREIID